jgi:hypothetical protein
MITTVKSILTGLFYCRRRKKGVAPETCQRPRTWGHSCFPLRRKAFMLAPADRLPSRPPVRRLPACRDQKPSRLARLHPPELDAELCPHQHLRQLLQFSGHRMAHNLRPTCVGKTTGGGRVFIGEAQAEETPPDHSVVSDLQPHFPRDGFDSLTLLLISFVTSPLGRIDPLSVAPQ